jgi:hypothetical protein
MYMLSGWFEKPMQKIGFEDVKYAIEHPLHYLIINTLPANEQKCLIKNTLPCEIEETTINEKITQFQMRNCFIIYGKNSVDVSVEKKYKQLCSLGFKNVYIYSGGLFEWLLLQDIYGMSEFPSTTRELDLLRFRANKTFDVPRIGY